MAIIQRRSRKELGLVMQRVSTVKNIVASNVFTNFLSPETKIHCEVFEDNEGALKLATMLLMTSRSKHIAVKYHFFREKVLNPLANIDVEKVHTDENKADIFTKGLVAAKFEWKRKFLFIKLA